MRQKPDQYVLLFEDEASFYRQPSQASLWSHWGRRQPYMRYSHRGNTRTRVIGYLNAFSGALYSQQTSKVTVPCLVKTLKQVSLLYPEARKIYLAWDNWPVHDHPRVQAALAKQKRIEVLWLPTYAPWLNPIEKVWRWLKQHVTHAHPWCDDFTEFKKQIDLALQPLAAGSADILKYTGLSK